MNYSIEVIADDQNKCGEAPTWDAIHNRLLWTDNETDRVWEYYTETKTKNIYNEGWIVCGIAINRDGNIVFAGPDGLCLRLGANECRSIAAEHDGEKLIFNDIVAGPAGQVYGGTFYYGPEGMEKHGKLYRIDADGSVHVMDEGIELSNGLSFSADNRTFYFADSAVRRIYAYDVRGAAGDLCHRRVFVQVPAEEGLPDGVTVDAEGFVWTAQWYAGQLVRYDPDGKVERRIDVPALQVSSLAFGGENLSDLYVTSASVPDPGPLAPPSYNPDSPDIGGALYRLRLDIQGKPEHGTNFPVA